MSRPVMTPPRTAILIPSKGRPEVLAKTFTKMPFLNDVDTYIGLERDEVKLYSFVIAKVGHRCRFITYHNPDGSVGLAREHLRKAAMAGGHDWFVITDDNAKYTADAVKALVMSAETWQRHTDQPTFMAGMHSTAMHFDRNLIKRKENTEGFTTYPGIGFIFHAVPYAWYSRYEYPRDCFALEDRHMMLSAIDRGLTEFRVCMDAPFSKSRYQAGGQGSIEKRRWNCGRSIERLAHDFPEMIGSRGTLPIPWQFIMSLRQGAKPDRLMGGAMRKSEVLGAQGKKRLTVKRRSR